MEIVRLRYLREAKALTQKQLADLLKTTTQYYQKYENGIRPIPIDRLMQLADYYDTSTDYILGRTDDPAPCTKPKKN